MTTEIAKLRNASGHALYCMLERPAANTDRKLACVLLSPGVKMRVAPHGLYRKLAEPFLERGITVLRVDFHGLGDSEGELPEVQLDQLYRQVQLGRHVQDVHAALDWLEHEQGFERFIVGGLCGGALTGLLAAEGEPRVAGLYTIGIPVCLDGPAERAPQHMTRGQLNSITRSYLGKLSRPSAWWRIVTLQSDFGLIIRSLASKLRKRKPQATIAMQANGKTPPATNLNPHFPGAYLQLLQRKTPVFLLFSGADRLYFEYQEKFAEPWQDELRTHESLVDLAVVENANHVLGDAAWVAEARLLTAQWLTARFG
jgi:pimeloyl-ACP methyl ester carboxylesterase